MLDQVVGQNKTAVSEFMRLPLIYSTSFSPSVCALILLGMVFYVVNLVSFLIKEFSYIT